MDSGGDAGRIGLATPFCKIDINGLVQYLKKNHEGPTVVEMLRLRAAIHFLKPELDPLSERMLEAYSVFRDMIEEPCSILDAGCMSGYLNHFLRQKKRNFTYVGIDSWDEALTVAREFQPGIDVRKCDILKDELPEFCEWPNGRHARGFDYVWCSNIVFDEPEKVVEKLLPLARRALVIAQPSWAGEYPGKQIDCGQTTIYVNEPIRSGTVPLTKEEGTQSPANP